MANDYTPQQIEEILQMFFDVAGTRQYIGARYVPIFGRGRDTSVDWDQSGAYEPLSIVYYQGDTYTSRRYVPAGISIDNQDYWVITGRYNAQVEQYRQEVLGFSTRIDGAYEAVDALRTETAEDYVPFPDSAVYPKYGTSGQVLSTLANGNTMWTDPVVPSDAQAEAVIEQWLDDHPEATTTVLDGSITTVKLADGAVTNQKLDPIGVLASDVAMNRGLTKYNQCDLMRNIDGLNHSESGITMTVHGNSVSVLGTTTANVTIPILRCNGDCIPFREGDIITVAKSGGNSSDVILLFYYRDGGGSHEIGRVTANGTYRFAIPNTSGMSELGINFTILNGHTLNEDMTLTINTVSAPDAVTSNLVRSILDANENLNLAIDSGLSFPITKNGLTFTKDHDNIHVSGTANNSNNIVFISTDIFDGRGPLVKNHDYWLLFDNVTKNEYLYIQVLYDTEETQNNIIYNHYISKLMKFTVPNDAISINVKLTYFNNKTYDNDVRIGIYPDRPHLDTIKTSWFDGKLIPTVKYAELDQNITVMLDSKNYNMVQEFISYYGGSFFTNYSTGNPDGWGLVLDNGIRLVGDGDTKIICDCTSFSSTVKSKFSPLMLAGDVTLENLIINAKNCRYCVHDDWTDKNVKARHKYHRCRMSHEDDGIRCIGGGLTDSMVIVIEDCEFSMNHSGTPVGYHNCVNANAVSRGVIRNCYFETGYPSFTYYGDSTLMTVFIVSGNSFAAGSPTTIPVTAESASYSNVNIELRQFNNEVRAS